MICTSSATTTADRVNHGLSVHYPQLPHISPTHRPLLLQPSITASFQPLPSISTLPQQCLLQTPLPVQEPPGSTAIRSNVGRRRANAVSLADSPARKGHSVEMARLFHKAQQTLLFQSFAQATRPSNNAKSLLSLPRRRGKQSAPKDNTPFKHTPEVCRGPSDDGNVSLHGLGKENNPLHSSSRALLVPPPALHTMTAMHADQKIRRDSGVYMSLPDPLKLGHTPLDDDDEDVGYWTGDDEFYTAPRQLDVQPRAQPITADCELRSTISRWLSAMPADPVPPEEPVTPKDEQSDSSQLGWPSTSKWRSTISSVQQTPRRFKIPARLPETPQNLPKRFQSSRVPTPHHPMKSPCVVMSGSAKFDSTLHTAEGTILSSNAAEETSASDATELATELGHVDTAWQRGDAISTNSDAPHDTVVLSPGVQLYRKGKHRLHNRPRLSHPGDEILGLDEQERRNLGLWTGLCGSRRGSRSVGPLNRATHDFLIS